MARKGHQLLKQVPCVALLLCSVVLLCGCEDPSVPQTVQPAPQVGSAERQRTEVVVPDFVKGHWQAVKIEVLDKEQNKQQVRLVTIGGDLVLEDSGIRLRVVTFLPHFIMDGMQLTSVSNDPKNPAAQIVIYENERESFSGWLFGLYPNTHAFQHPRYSFSLLGYVPAAEKEVDKPTGNKG